MDKLNNVDKGVSLIERVLGIVKKYSIFDFIKGCAVVLLIAAMIGLISNPTWIFEKYEEWQEKAHTEKLEHRLQNNEKLHILVEKLMYRVNADRVLVLELHNGNSANSGLPFAKCSATYEALNDGISPVADQYQDLNLSLMPFATELFNKGYWCGNTEELKEIDRALCYRMLGNDTSHFAGFLIKGVGKPLAFIFVKFRGIDQLTHNCEELKKIINDNLLEIALLLELNKGV